MRKQILGAAQLAFTLLSLPAIQASAANLNCSESSTAVEVAICGDETLRSADEELSRLQERVNAANISATDEGATWIANVRDACGDTECLSNAYLARISELEKKLNDVRELPPVAPEVAPVQVPQQAATPQPESPEPQLPATVVADNSPKPVETPAKTGGGGLIIMLVLIGLVVIGAMRSSKSNCDMCGAGLKNKSYSWKIEDKKQTLCPKCNSRMENRQSKIAFKAAFDD